MKPEIKVGQTWKSRDGGSLLKVSLVDETHAHGASPDGSKPRKVALARLTAKGRNGYELWEDARDAPPEAKADDAEPEDCAHGVHFWTGPRNERLCGRCGLQKPAGCVCDFRKGQHRFSCATQGRALTASRGDDGRLRVDAHEAKAGHQHVWIPREGVGFDCKNCPAFGVGAVVPASADATPPVAPSPLEVVRHNVEQMQKGWANVVELSLLPPQYRLDAETMEMGGQQALAALATLGESIRADERARVGDELQRRGYPVAGGAVLAMKR